jgi:hypothetical protein
VNHRPIELGTILFTLVDPHRGHEVAYNRWYERDHFYAGCMIGPGILAGRRWVSTRPYKDLRYPSESPITGGAADRGSYLALYWVDKSMQNDWGSWGAKQVKDLHAAGRMFGEREHIHTKLYRYLGGGFRDEDGVPPELALDHPYKGLVAMFGETNEGVDGAQIGRWYGEEFFPRALEGSATAMTLVFRPVGIPDDAPPDIPRVPEDSRRFLHLSFLERDPLEVWDDEFAGHGNELEATGLARLLWASPFIPTIPGTDAYADELW